nr:glycosyltransferase family 2 protein [uncultured Treponema sp.]
MVPVYNVEKYIRRCLDSIKGQSLPDFECILIDDGSPDNSPVICDEYAKKDNRIKVIHKVNGGVSSARNAGLDAAKGEWVCFVDSDDWVENNYLQELENKNEGNCDLVFFNIVDEFKNYSKIFMNQLMKILYLIILYLNI